MFFFSLRGKVEEERVVPMSIIIFLSTGEQKKLWWTLSRPMFVFV